MTRTDKHNDHSPDEGGPMKLIAYHEAAVQMLHLAWLLPSDNPDHLQGDYCPGDVLQNADGYLYYVATNGEFLSLGHSADPGCFRRILAQLRKDSEVLFDLEESPEKALYEMLLSLRQQWIHERIEVQGRTSPYQHASFLAAKDVWRSTVGRCRCGTFCVCLYTFPCSVCGIQVIILGEDMQGMAADNGQCHACRQESRI